MARPGVPPHAGKFSYVFTARRGPSRAAVPATHAYGSAQGRANVGSLMFAALLALLALLALALLAALAPPTSQTTSVQSVSPV